MLLATAFGAGYSRVAPGTAGSAVGLALFFALQPLAPAWQLAATAALALVGVAVSTHVAKRVGNRDPAIVVIDEVAGIWASLLLLPLTPATVALGFVLFRLLDMTKPFPVRQLEALPWGLGIMADDLMAGLYANLLLRVIAQLVPLA